MFARVSLLCVLFVFGLVRLMADEVAITHTAVLMLAEEEYKTETTVPDFAKKYLRPLGIAAVVVNAEPEGSNDFPALEKVLPTADVLFISVKRRALSDTVLALIKAHLAAGKPLIGIRTASHAFALRKGNPPAGYAQWLEFDSDILGGSYTGHFGNEPALLSLADDAVQHPILRGVDLTSLQTKRLYKNPTLGPQTTPLVRGQSTKSKDIHHVAWCNQVGKSRIFYTSLGLPDEFSQPAFTRLLTNAVLWSLGREADITAP